MVCQYVNVRSFGRHLRDADDTMETTLMQGGLGYTEPHRGVTAQVSAWESLIQT